jgi:hypothetical protein
VPSDDVRAVLESAYWGASVTEKRRFAELATTQVRRKYYTCAKDRRGCGKVNADLRWVDRELRTLVVARLSDSRYAAALSAARSQVADRLTAVNAEIADCEGLQKALSVRLGRRAMTLAAFDQANEPLAKDLAVLYAERDSLSGGSVGGPITAEAPAVIGARWDTADVTERRSMLIQALDDSTLFLDRYRQRPGPRTFDRERLRMVDPTMSSRPAPDSV